MPKNIKPVARVTGPSDALVNFPVTIYPTASEDVDGVICSCLVDWGDGDTTSFNGVPPSAAHTFTEVGSYSIRVTVRDNKRTSDRVTLVVNIVDDMPVPSPVNCVLSDWLMIDAGPWGDCSPSGVQTRWESWARTVVTAPAFGGTACGPLTESRTGMRSCVFVPGPTPVDCVLSAWAMTSAGAWTDCSPQGQQTRTETWERTVVTPPSNGGAVCGPLSEQRVGMQACVYVPPDPPPAPIDCVLSAWAMTAASPWGVCQSNGQQTRSETWTRTVVTPPANGGAACGPLSELRVGTQACTYVPPTSPPGSWPDPLAYWNVRPAKTAGHEMTDPVWAHLHFGEVPAESITVHVTIDHKGNEVLASAQMVAAQLKIRYTVNGIVVSPWLSTPPYSFTLLENVAELAALPSGIYDLSVEVDAIPSTSGQHQTNPGKHDFGPYPMFVHLGGRPSVTTIGPVLQQNIQDNGFDMTQKDGHYLDAALLVPKGYPVPTAVTPWTQTPPYAADLWQESLQPHSQQFLGAQMLWEEPPGTINAGLKFVRAFLPKAGEPFRNLWNNGGAVAPSAFGFSGHRSFPVKDGPRGIGWTNGYVQGVCDADGRLWMVNISGQLRVMHPDGELVTLVGWRVKPTKQPVWYLKPLDVIRENMEFRGTFTNGGNADVNDPGWHQPMDVALDPNNPNRVFVTSFYDNAVYQVLVDRSTWTGTVSVLAGDPNHSAGFVNGTGTAARFRGPLSIVASLSGASLYVTDHDNHAIRRIVVATGAVTTIFGGTDVSALEPLGQAAARAHPSAVIAGPNPTIFYPFWLRIASTGELVLFDRGFNTLRKLTISSTTATLIRTLGDSDRTAWNWGDVDRWGVAGALDGIYWGNATSLGPLPTGEVGDRFNENYRYTALDGSLDKWVFGESHSWKPTGAGPVLLTRGPHYPWLIAVDPRGAVLFGGIGDHGLTRLRLRKPTDPNVTQQINTLAFLDQQRVWNAGARGVFSYTLPPRPALVPANPLALWFGWEASNYLGLPSAWQIGPTTTDAQIDALFQWPPAIANDSVALAAVRAYVRLYRGAV